MLRSVAFVLVSPRQDGARELVHAIPVRSEKTFDKPIEALNAELFADERVIRVRLHGDATEWAERIGRERGVYILRGMQKLLAT